jgi:hypothetical protein
MTKNTTATSGLAESDNLSATKNQHRADTDNSHSERGGFWNSANNKFTIGWPPAMG